jgi:hypothetical protein
MLHNTDLYIGLRRYYIFNWIADYHKSDYSKCYMRVLKRAERLVNSWKIV